LPRKSQLTDHQFHNNEEIEMVIHEGLQMQMPDFYSERIFKLKPKLEKCITVLGGYAGKQ
jgi:hypothetical protein